MANRLINEQSPYLLQHAHNPVDWYPWSDEPFEIAKRENKPVLVSIGYAACHWCHVMERESFENEAVATYMNQHFICIKVDREEHPDVDHMYMDAVQAISGSGGWPLNAFATPERVPFYGGTYFPPKPMYNRSSWLQILERINEIWNSQQDEVQAQSKQMVQYLQQASQTLSKGIGNEWNKENLATMCVNLLKQADKELGGFGNAPKFPGTMATQYLLEHYRYTGNEEALKQALLNLDSMINGGIYDQLGGGLCRYSTDEKWLAPHFEKMLYDNALFVSVLCDAYSITKKPLYCKVIEETIAFAERELRDASGGYYSALDADSEGVEGKFYTWTWHEWEKIDEKNDTLIQRYFGVNENGNWEHTNILHVAEETAMLAKQAGMAENELEERIDGMKKKLFEARERRMRPLTDDKCLLSWNALMNIALTKAGIVLQQKQYTEKATDHMRWMLESFLSREGLMHTWKAGRARIAANLDDHAYLVQAMLQLASANGDTSLIAKAADMQQTILKDFMHEEQVMFYYSSVQQKDLPVRKVDLHDGVMPSANAVMAQNLAILGMCMEAHEMTEQAAAMLRQMAGSAQRYTYSFAWWASIMQRQTAGLKTVLCTGRHADTLRNGLNDHFLPECYFISSEKEISDVPLLSLKLTVDEGRIFVCTQQECYPPALTAEAALRLIAY